MYLWVVGCGQVMLDAENFHQLIIQLVHKLFPLVTGQHVWQPHAHEDLSIKLEICMYNAVMACTCVQVD